MSHALQVQLFLSPCLLVQQNFKLVYAKMALETTGTAFVFTSQVGSDTLPYSKNTKRMYISKTLLHRQLRKNQL